MERDFQLAVVRVFSILVLIQLAKAGGFTPFVERIGNGDSNEVTLRCSVNTGNPVPVENARFWLNGTTNVMGETVPEEGEITFNLQQRTEGYYTCDNGNDTSSNSITLVCE